MINPLPLVVAMLRQHWVIAVSFIVLLALAIGIGGAITAQERALRSGSARAADRFDLIVAAPGSQTDLLLRVVFLQPGAVELIEGDALRMLLSDERAAFVAPIGFGDNHDGDPVIGTIGPLVLHLSGGALAEGDIFTAIDQAVVGSASPLAIGDVLRTTHGLPGELEATEHGQGLTVVGRMAPTGTPWDRAVLTPIEFTWSVHGLGTGHGTAEPVPVGPPFDLDSVPGIPAAVVSYGGNLATAYGLRNAYRTNDTMAFFPAEVLVQLYELLGDVRIVMTGLAIATEVLLVAAILAGILILMRLYRQRFAVLRALGASRLYVFAVAWTFSFALIATGSLAGLGVAAALVGVVSGIFSASSGIAMTTGIGWTEIGLALTLTLVGALLAVLPAAVLYRRPVVEALRGG